MRKTITALGGAIACTALTAVLAAPNAAFAIEPLGSDIVITGTVPHVTYIPAPTAEPGQNASFAAGALTITDLADDEAKLKSASITIKFNGVTTNYPAKIALMSKNGGLISSSRDFVIPYKVLVESNGLTIPECDFNGQSAGQINCTNTEDNILFTQKDVSININIAEGNEVLSAGVYSDTLTFMVGASL